MAAAALKSSFPSSPADVGDAWASLLRMLPDYDPFAQAEGYWFDADAAGYAIGWIEHHLKLAKGKKGGKPFILEAWQKSIVANIFGWKHIDTGLRRFRECLMYVAKKNGKSAFVAALLLFVLSEDGEPGAEIYSAASSRDQAALIFAHATGMVRQSDYLSKRFKVYGAKGGSQMRSIVFDEEMSSYKCLSADANTADGANPHFVAVDELHRHKSPELSEVLESSTAERSQPLVMNTTTADYNRPSLCNSKLKYAKQVRENGGDKSKPGYDPAFLPVVYEASKDDDWTSPETWRKANPNIDVTVPEDFLRRQCLKAIETPSELNNFLRLHLNIVTDADEAFLDMDKWDACGDEIDADDLLGHECTGGLDLASTTDIAALVLEFKIEGKFYWLCFFWIPRENAIEREHRDQVPYTQWEREGHIKMTEGDVIDYDVIRADINALAGRYHITGLAVDRWNSTQLQTQLAGDGIDIVQFGQGYASMSAPTKDAEAIVISSKLRHGANPILRWMAGNLSIERDAAGNIKPSKKKAAQKIDGMVAGIMAHGIGMVTTTRELQGAFGL